MRSNKSTDVRLRTTIASVFALLFLTTTASLASAHLSVVIPADDHVTVLTLTLKQGEKVDYSWEAQGPVRFQILTVGGLEQVTLAGLTGNGRFTAPTDGTYSFRFDNQNPDFPVTVSYSIEQVKSSIGMAILIVFVVLAAVALLALLAYVIIRNRARSGQPPVQ